MANSNIEYLNEYLNQQLDSTYDEIREIISQNEDSYKELEKYQNLMFKKAWLLTQLDNIVYELSINK
jgi:hypothetical protein